MGNGVKWIYVDLINFTFSLHGFNGWVYLRKDSYSIRWKTFCNLLMDDKEFGLTTNYTETVTNNDVWSSVSGNRMKCSAIFDVKEQPNSLYRALDVVKRNIFFAFSVQLLLPLTSGRVQVSSWASRAPRLRWLKQISRGNVSQSDPVFESVEAPQSVQCCSLTGHWHA